MSDKTGPEYADGSSWTRGYVETDAELDMLAYLGIIEMVTKWKERYRAAGGILVETAESWSHFEIERGKDRYYESTVARASDLYPCGLSCWCYDELVSYYYRTRYAAKYYYLSPTPRAGYGPYTQVSGVLLWLHLQILVFDLYEPDHDVKHQRVVKCEIAQFGSPANATVVVASAGIITPDSPVAFVPPAPDLGIPPAGATPAPTHNYVEWFAEQTPRRSPPPTPPAASILHRIQDLGARPGTARRIRGGLGRSHRRSTTLPRYGGRS